MRNKSRARLTTRAWPGHGKATVQPAKEPKPQRRFGAAIDVAIANGTAHEVERAAGKRKPSIVTSKMGRYTAA